MKTRRGWKSPPRVAGTGPMWTLMAQYFEMLRARNYSPETVRHRESNLHRFLHWCDERSLAEPTEVTQPIIERYQRWLYYYRRPDGHPLTFRTQSYMLAAVKWFFRWMTRQHLTLFNPAAEIDLPRLGHRLPRDVLTLAEIEAVLSQPDVAEPLGIRDRAILETFYATGLRRSELAHLALYDLEPTRGTVMVRQGKGRKDRVVPIGHRARAWIEKYVTDVRPEYVVDPDEKALFLTASGASFDGKCALGDLVKRYLQAAGIEKSGACHIFRHTMATLMLENGADVRYIQEILGHAQLTTTQIYTHVSIAKLQQIYQATHPAELPRAGPAPPPDERERLQLLDDDDPDAG